MAAIDKLLQAAIKNRVDAVLLEPGRLPRMRKGGSEQEVTQTVLDRKGVELLLAEVAPMRRLPEPNAAPRWEFDHEVDGVVVHFACLASAAGWTALASPKLAPPAAPASSTERGVGPPPVEKVRRAFPPIEDLLRAMIELGASDLHLAAYEPPCLRLNGELQPFETYEPATSARLKELLFAIANERQRTEFERTNDACFSHEITDLARFRVHLLRDHLGVGAAIRHVPLAVPTTAALELPPAAERLADFERGLVVVAGPPGSGRTTTLAALIERINERRRSALLALASPIEFVHRRARTLVRQREIPTHAPSFAAALSAARSEDVETVAVDGRLDAAAIEEAIALAAAGSLVLLTVEAVTAGAALAGLAERVAPERRRQVRAGLAEAFRGAIGLTLLPRLGGGRIAAREVLLGSPAVAGLVREGRWHQLPAAAERAGDGSTTQTEVLAELVALRLVAPRAAWLRVARADALLERLRAADPTGTLLRELDLQA